MTERIFISFRLQTVPLCVNIIELNKISHGGLTERLRSLIGNQVRRNSPVGSSPMSSARCTGVCYTNP